MRLGILFLFTAALLLSVAIPVGLNDSINLIPPAVNPDGTTIVFASGSPPGSPIKGTNLFRFMGTAAAGSLQQLTRYFGNDKLTGVTNVALAGGVVGYSALPTGPGGAEEVHVIDTGTLADRTVATDKQGCIQPLCLGCFHSCIGSVHVSSDGGKILYYVARERPLYTVNRDGTGLTQMPVYSAMLAPSAQRIITRDSRMVFTSFAPSGPTFAAAATDVYTINLDGTGQRQVTRFGDAQFYARAAVISDDGAVIAFETNYSPAGHVDANQIWTIRSDGTDLRMLSSGATPATNPSISADGSVVTFLQDGQVRRARPADPSILTLTDLSLSSLWDPVVTGDGTQVAFSLGPKTNNAAAVYRISSSARTELHDFFPVYIPRYVSPAGVAAATGDGSPSPGSLLTVYGANLGRSELEQAAAFPLPTTLNGVTLLVNGQPVPLTAVTPWQINAQLPQSAAVGKAVFQVRVDGADTMPVSMDVGRTAPSNFSYAFTRGNFYMQAAAYHAGTSIPADPDHPATGGETLEVYGAGFGLTDPPVEAGQPSPASPLARVLELPQVQIAGRDATVTFAGLAPGFAGVYQINVVVPAGLAPGLAGFLWKGTDIGVIRSSIAVK
jgi:uncharacterized protein (TIGR03437 family)